MNIRPIVAVLAAGGALLSASSALAECQFNKLGELAVSKNGPPSVEITVNGKTGRLRVDTGSYSTRLTAAGAAMLGAFGDANGPVRMVSPNGETTYRTQTLKDVVLGGTFLMPRFDVLISDEKGGETGDVIGSLGLDVLAASDVEFDFANGRIAFFQPKGCGKLPLAYWGQAFSVAETRRPSADRPQIVTTIKLNGKPLNAQIITSGGYSLLDRPSALAAGVGPETAGVRSVGTVQFGGPRDAWLGTFASFAVGEEEIKNAKIVFASLWDGMKWQATGSRLGQRADDLPSMLLGMDFLRSHRVLIANSQGRMYFSYNGGPVFARPTAP